MKIKIKTTFKKETIYTIICALLSTTLTWYLNHILGYGAIVSNGLIGVMAAIFLPNDLAGISYTSSFVGMSSLSVIPNIGVAALGGLIVSIVLLTTAEIYAGIGGKGGTTAALSTLITKGIRSFLG